LAEDRLDILYKDPKKAKFSVLKKYKGTELVGMKYKPLFDYFAHVRIFISADFLA
jgi:isoleucyl-tRNA synthetase